MRELFSQIHKGKNNTNAKKIICINTNEIFETMTEAAKRYSISIKDIQQVCAGVRLTAKKLQFAYYEDGKEYKTKPILSRKKGDHPRARKIICLNNKMVFDSVVSASEFFGINYTNIHQVLLGKSNFVMDSDGQCYQFAYYEEGKEYQLKEIDYSTIKKPKKVICINTGEIFNSTTEAAEKMGVGQAKVSLCCNNKREHTGSYQFAFYEEGKKYMLKELKNKRAPKKVICLNTGEIFNTTREAAEKMGIQQSGISLCCNGKRSYSGKLPDGTKLKWEFC